MTDDADGHHGGVVRVDEVMVTDPRRLPPGASVGDARTAFGSGHVHMLLLAEGDRLLGTLVRDDLDGAPDDAPALPRGVLDGRTVSPYDAAQDALDGLVARGERRLAVVDDDGRLLGLLCLKRRLHGFCSDDDVSARARRG